MATTLPAKSILKQPTTQPSLSEEQQAKAEANKRHLVTALHHANIIQSRKDAEARIFGNIETLLEFPSATPFTPVDASRFVGLVRPFQPSDYENLVEERRIDGKCGYPLCSNPPRSETMGKNVAWKVEAQGGASYCSNDCTRKSLYVKVQLSEVPVWERQSGESPHVVLHVDDRQVAAPQPAGPNRTHVDHQELALERGEAPTSRRPGQVMTTTVVERENVGRPADSFQAASAAAIEGYEPSSQSGRSVVTRPKVARQETPATKEQSVDPVDPVVDSTQVRSHAEMEEEAAWREMFVSIQKQ